MLITMQKLQTLEPSAHSVLLPIAVITACSCSYDCPCINSAPDRQWRQACMTHQSLFTTHHSPLTTHHSPLTPHPSPLTTHHSPLTTHHSPLFTHRSPLTNHHSPLTTHHSSLAVPAGGFDKEEDAARAHDVMAVKCRGMKSITNYNHTDYKDLLPQLEKLSKASGLTCPFRGHPCRGLH